MKNLIFYILLLLLTSCVDQHVDYYDYVMYNQTDKTVKVLGFNAYNYNRTIHFDSAIAADPIHIEPYGKFKVIRQNGIDSDITKRFYSIKGVDSIRVVFDNERVLICADDTISDQTIYYGGSDGIHYITKQDYEDATVCDGDCE